MLANFIAPTTQTPTVSLFQIYEHRINATTLPSNPFAFFCTVAVLGPSGSRKPNRNLTMFYDGGHDFSFRLAPDAVGEWTWTTHCEHGYGLDGKHGVVKSTRANGAQLGGLIIDPEAPTQLIYESGSRYTLVGLEVDWLWAIGLLHGEAAMQAVVDGLDALGINHVLVQLYANHTGQPVLPPLTPPRVSPTSTIPWASVPHHSWPADQHTLDLAFWRNYELMLSMFTARNMIAHVMFFVGNKHVRWPDERSAADDIYWKTAMARLSVYPSIVLDVSKEAGSANSKRPVSYFVDRMRLMASMNAHGRLLTAHSGFDWTNKCDAAPELCQLTSAQIHLGENAGIQDVAHLYYPTLERTAATAKAPYIDVEYFYQWGVSDGCHFSCCNACTNSTATSAPTAEANLDEMRRVMWDHYMAGAAIAGACWYHNDLGWDIFDPRALSTTASTMATLRTLRDFWEGIDRRAYVVRAPELCVRNVQPAHAVIRCLLKLDHASQPTAMILHVRSDRPSFELITSARPAHQYTYETNKNCYGGKGCDDIDEGSIQASGHEECERLCDARDDCDCFVYHPSDQHCWRRKNCHSSSFLHDVGYRIYTKTAMSPQQQQQQAQAQLTSDQITGVWIDPTSNNSTTAPFVAGGRVQQPSSFRQDAVLSLSFKSSGRSTMAHTSTCVTGADCAGYNGACIDNRCVCTPGWQGITCAEVSFVPGAQRAYNESLWTWGGSIVRDDDGRVHMFSSEMTNHCGIMHYCSNSRVIHLTADHPLGPYARRGVALEPRPPPAWDSGAVHGPTIHRLSDGSWALYYMGTSNTWDPKNGSHPNCTLAADPQQGSRATRRIGIATAASPFGPWTRRDAPIFGPGTHGTEWDWSDVSNPTPVLLPNGSTLLLYKGRGHVQAMGAAVAADFDGPFVRTSPNAPVLAAAVEDTWAWVRPAVDGVRPWTIHTLSHVGNGAHAAGGHAWSADGVHWNDTTVTPGGVPSYTGEVTWSDGTTTVLARRERPQVLLTADDGEPAVICTSAQSENDRHKCADGGAKVPAACRSFTMCEQVRG